uniref:Uncharacterized protein n=1 Tax=Seriola lalandi dorsalis TaxID=1841481 RepID=A0A3B4YCH5_SERLL
TAEVIKCFLCLTSHNKTIHQTCSQKVIYLCVLFVLFRSSLCSFKSSYPAILARLVSPAISGSFSTPAQIPVYKTPKLSEATVRLIDSVLASGSGLEVELFGIGMWSLGLGAVGAALAGIFLANTDMCLPKPAMASLEYLEDADLRSTIDDNNVVRAKSLWERNGAVVMAVRRPG